MTQKPEYGSIILFRMPKAKNKELVKFCRKLYGYKDHSNREKYIYERKGIISEIPHIKINPIRSALIIEEKNTETIVESLELLGAEVIVRKVKLENEDKKQLKK